MKNVLLYIHEHFNVKNTEILSIVSIQITLVIWILNFVYLET